MINLKNIATEYLRSFKTTAGEEEKVSQSEKNKLIQQKLKKGTLSIEDTAFEDKQEEAKVVFTKILPHSKKLAEDLNTEEVIDEGAWRDLNLICGNDTTPDEHALNAIKRTKTTVGDCVLATEMVNPHTDEKEIAQKQEVTKILRKEKKLKKEIDAELNEIKKHEATRLSFWKNDNALQNESFQKEVNGSFYSWLGLDRLNLFSSALQLKKTLFDLLLVLMPLLPIIQLSISVLIGVYYTYNSIKMEYIKVAISAYIDLFFYQQQYMALIMFFSFSLMLHRSYGMYIRYKTALNVLAAHLLPFQILLKKAEKLSNLVKSHPALEKRYGHNLRYTRELLASSNDGTEVGKLVYHLQTTRLKNRWYFFSLAGNLLVAYKLLQKHKDALADLTYEIGKIDAQVSIPTLMEESEAHSSQNHFVYGEIKAPVEGNAPMLDIKEMWNFGLDAQKAISNDLSIGTESNNIRFITLTGPNAGGKSTYILGIGLNVILHQAFGIASAKSFKQTIFYRVLTYVNPTQNLATGLSLAEAGMEVLRKHKETLETTQKPTLAIVDEILNGTDPKVAEKYSHKILSERYKDYPNCATLLTTHYMKLTNLADTHEGMVNKKVEVVVPGTQGRRFDYTFKIKEGVSDQNIVEDMLLEKGIL